jgi:hypothetical protein
VKVGHSLTDGVPVVPFAETTVTWNKSHFDLTISVNGIFRFSRDPRDYKRLGSFSQCGVNDGSREDPKSRG